MNRILLGVILKMASTIGANLENLFLMINRLTEEDEMSGMLSKNNAYTFPVSNIS
jgi:hypothetical protein